MSQKTSSDLLIVNALAISPKKGREGLRGPGTDPPQLRAPLCTDSIPGSQWLSPLPFPWPSGEGGSQHLCFPSASPLSSGSFTCAHEKY